MHKIKSSRLKQLIGAVAIGSIFCAVQAANEGAIDWAAYEIYYGNFNGDGASQDIYFRGKPKFILLYGDISVPLYLPGPSGFALFQNPDGSHSEAVPIDYPTTSLTSAQQALPADYVVGDINNDGNPDILLRGKDATAVSLLIGGGVTSEPKVLAEIASDGRVYTATTGWSSAGRVAQNVANRSISLTLTPGQLAVAGSLYSFGATSGIIAYETVETTFTYDDLGRLNSLQASDGANVSYTQDKDNNFTSTLKAKSGL